MRHSQSKQLEDKIYFSDSLQCTKYACLDGNCHTVDLSPKYFPPCQSVPLSMSSCYLHTNDRYGYVQFCETTCFLFANHALIDCLQLYWGFLTISPVESNCPSMCSSVEIENALNVKEGGEIPFEQQSEKPCICMNLSPYPSFRKSPSNDFQNNYIFLFWKSC